MNEEEALRIWRAIQGTAWDSLRDDVVERPVRYARIRVDWLLADREKRADMEEDRTRCHNAMITCLDILARNMKARGEDASWRDLLGNDRKVIGDFACCLHAILGISAR